MQTATDVLLALFLALGSAWFAVDLARKFLGFSAISDDARTARPEPKSFAPGVAVVPASAPQSADVSPQAEDVPAEHFVAIAAAVHHLFKGRARLISAATTNAAPAATGSAPTFVDWAREGRRDIFSSHRVR